MTTPPIPVTVPPVMPIFTPPMLPLNKFKHKLKHKKESEMLLYIYILCFIIVFFLIGAVSTGSSTFTQIPIKNLKNNQDLTLNIDDNRVFINTTPLESSNGFTEERMSDSILNISGSDSSIAGASFSSNFYSTLELNKFYELIVGSDKYESESENPYSIGKIRVFATSINSKKVEVCNIDTTTESLTISTKSHNDAYGNTLFPCIKIDKYGKCLGNFFQPLCASAQGTSKRFVPDSAPTTTGVLGFGLKPTQGILKLNFVNVIDQECYDEHSKTNAPLWILPFTNLNIGDFVVVVISGVLGLPNNTNNTNGEYQYPEPIQIVTYDRVNFGLGSTILNGSITQPGMQIAGITNKNGNSLKIQADPNDPLVYNISIKFTYSFNCVDSNPVALLNKTWCFEAKNLCETAEIIMTDSSIN